MSQKTDQILQELGYKIEPRKTPQPQTPDVPQGRDLFQTPSYATDLLIPFIPSNIRTIWEPACGDGKIVQRLTDNKFGVYPSDIRQSMGWVQNHVHNFITESVPLSFVLFPDNWGIITNPPFSLTRKFYERCLEYNVPFALLINADYKQWTIDAVRVDGCEKIIPNRRIDYITPTGLSGESGHTADFHSMWLTRGFNLGKTETFVELSLQQKKENI